LKNFSLKWCQIN